VKAVLEAIAGELHADQVRNRRQEHAFPRHHRRRESRENRGARKRRSTVGFPAIADARNLDGVLGTLVEEFAVVP
jgi:hypothetical protein